MSLTDVRLFLRRLGEPLGGPSKTKEFLSWYAATSCSAPFVSGNYCLEMENRCVVVVTRYMQAFPSIMGIARNGMVRYRDLLEILPMCSISEQVRQQR